MVVRSVLLGVLALGIRAVFVRDFASLPLFDVNLVPGTDMEVLVAWARRIAAGDILSRGTGPFWWAPLYPYTLGGLLAIVGASNLHLAALAQASLGAISCVLVYLLGRALLGEVAGFAGGLLAVVYGPAIFYTGVFLSTTLEVLLSTATLLALTLARARQTPLAWSLTGLLAGLACLARPNFLLAVIVLCLAMPLLLVRQPDGKVAWARSGILAGVFALTALVVVAPATVRNWTVGGRFVLVSAAGPETFRIANSYDSTALNFVYPKLPQMPVGSQAFWKHQLRKATLFWWGFEPPQNVNYYLARQLSPVLALPWLSFWVAVPLCALGLWITRVRWRDLLHLYVFLGAYYLSVVAFFIIARWRLPLVVPLLIFGGAGLHTLIGWARDRRWKSLVPALAAVAVLALLIYPGSGPFVFAADHGELGYILANRGAFEEAQVHLRLAARGLPDNPTLQRDVGILLLRLSRPADAAPFLERAVALAPDDPSAHHYLGKLLILAGSNPALARSHLERALALAPDGRLAAEGHRLLRTVPEAE